MGLIFKAFYLDFLSARQKVRQNGSIRQAVDSQKNVKKQIIELKMSIHAACGMNSHK